MTCPTKLEKSLENSIRSYLEKRGWKTIKTIPSEKGMPDLICLRSGKTFFLEIKRNTKAKAGFYQARKIQELRSLGFVAEFVRSWEEFLNVYEKMIGGWNGIV